MRPGDINSGILEGQMDNGSLGMLNDSQLVELTREGDHEAFGELIRRHRPKCVSLAYFFLRDRSDAEDQAQDAFFKAYQHLDQFHGEAEFSVWLKRIVANQCLMLMRLRRRTRVSYLDGVTAGPDAMPIQLAAGGPDPEGELACRQLTDGLRNEVRRLPGLLRNVILLHDIAGLSMMDSAARLGITIPAAKSRLGRARAELQQRMARYLEGVRNPAPLSNAAAPLDKVGRHYALQAR
jgi:RNA polymerase sigma-70 factor, ECF subfamily